MGDYTGLQIDIRISPQIPSGDLAALEFMVNHVDRNVDRNVPQELPGHRLFARPRWALLLTCQSAYFPECQERPRLEPAPEGLRLRSKSSLKNYEKEIQCFIDWIRPWIIRGEIGYRFEYDEQWVLVEFGV